MLYVYATRFYEYNSGGGANLHRDVRAKLYVIAYDDDDVEARTPSNYYYTESSFIFLAVCVYMAQ